jgi:cysteine-rich repeat protein
MILLALACRGKDGGDLDSAGETTDSPVGPVCGDGTVDAGEACDEGGETSTCRADCTIPTCGDAALDAAEGCDDGGLIGGDGCDPLCREEAGPPEVEPNDDPLGAADLPPLGYDGHLWEKDRDCHAIEVGSCQAVQSRLDDGFGGCPASPAVIELVDPDGLVVAVGGPDADGCSAIDPGRAPGAAWMPPGRYAVCASGSLGDPVPGYRLSALVLPSTGLPLPGDRDGDGLADRCDEDRDGDGLPNDVDACPDLSNGPKTPPPTVDSQGFFRHWLQVGPFVGTKSADACRPSDPPLLGGDDDGLVEPQIGDPVGDLSWTVAVSPDSRVDYLPRYGGVPPAREVYGVVWFELPADQDVVLAAGPDDGFFAWVDGERVLEVAGCQGTNVDQFQAPLSLTAGWHRLMVKVRDQGGGWGLYLRLLDTAGAPVLGLPLSLNAEGTWRPDDTDSDGDGVPDACDG